jgi:hypothetical protein
MPSAARMATNTIAPTTKGSITYTRKRAAWLTRCIRPSVASRVLWARGHRRLQAGEARTRLCTTPERQGGATDLLVATSTTRERFRTSPALVSARACRDRVTAVRIAPRSRDGSPGGSCVHRPADRVERAAPGRPAHASPSASGISVRSRQWPYDHLDTHGDEFSSRDRSLTASHRRRKESAMSSLRVDLITDHHRSLRPGGLKPC